MVTCRQCGKLMAKGCQCFEGIEYIGEYTRLAINETRVIRSVRTDIKKLYLVSETTRIRKQAKITKLNHFGITAQETFKGNEIGGCPFFLRLEEENGDLVYRKLFETKLDDDDSIAITWKLEVDSQDRFGMGFIRKLFGGKENPKFLSCQNKIKSLVSFGL